MSRSLLLHFDGEDGSTTFTDEEGHSFTATGNAQIDTAQSVFGGASGLFDGSGDYIYTSMSSDFQFGTGNFTIDFRFRLNSLKNMDPIGTGYGSGFMCQYVHTQTPKKLRLWLAGSYYDFNTTLSTDTWYHVAYVRDGTDLYCFLDGTQVGSTLSSSDDVDSNYSYLRIGVDVQDNSTYVDGWLDELRVLKGEAAWTSDFTPPSSAYNGEEPATGGFMTLNSKMWGA